MVQVKHSEIDVTEWLRVARGYEVKVMSREGNVYKFNGFMESVSIIMFVVNILQYNIIVSRIMLI